VQAKKEEKLAENEFDSLYKTHAVLKFK